MKIHVNRNGTSFGPYEEAEARSLYARGNIAPTDLVWHEGMAEWQSASQVFGAVPAASVAPPVIAPPVIAAPPMAPPVQIAPPYSQSPQAQPMPGYAAPAGGYAGQPMAAQGLPLPPKLHWALVLLFSVLTFGIFVIVWMFLQSAWVRRIDARSNATTYLIVYVVMAVIGGVIGTSDSTGVAGFGALLQLASYVVFYVAYYSMRRSMIDYFNGPEPIGLRLSGVMTFFFTLLYLQHHMTRIAEWKTTGVLRPQ